MTWSSNYALTGPGALRSVAAMLAWGLLSTLAAPVLAQDVSAEEKSAARDLALEGIELAKSGKCSEAVGKLQRAETLYHAPTILTWIGQCQIEMGYYVQGTETLNQVIRERLPSDAPPAYADAQTKAKKLLAETRPKIAKLTIDVVGPQGSLNDLDGLVVEVDEAVLSQALIGAPRPTDPGTHTIKVEAPGYQPHEKSIELEAAARESLSIILEPLAQSAAEGAAPISNEAPEPKSTRSTSNSKLIGWSLMGGGGAFLVAGGTLGALALSSEKKLNCPNDSCPASEESQLNKAKTQATLSTVFFGVGGAAVVASVVVLLTGKSSSAAEVGKIPGYQGKHIALQPELGWGSLQVHGKF